MDFKKNINKYWKQIKKLYERIPQRYRLGVIVSLVFLIYMIFFDSNNVIFQIKQYKELNKLRKAKHYYQKEIKKDKQRMIELTTDTVNLIKYAREQYLMKKENEDIFIIQEKEINKANK